jgi:hypothetical protein
VVLRLATNRTTTTGEEYELTQAALDQLASLYPNVDALATARRATAWLIANPKRRKTAGGMPQFLNSWFAREQNRPQPAARRTSLEEDLNDTSWALPPATPAPATPAPDRGGFKALSRLQELYTGPDPDDVIARCGEKLLAAQGAQDPGGELQEFIGDYGSGRVLDAVMVGMAGVYTDPSWLRRALAASADEIPKDWAPGAGELAQLADAGLHEDLGVKSRDVFLNWFTYTGIRHAGWGDLFVRMCLIEWSRAEGSRDQYLRGLAAADSANHQAWREPA